ncbi:hypothetical protein LTS14_005439 [Recurvomyces mirabilis]|uniref:uncharacterized protein n=1 Tax=Recurvomyces mirabilis TaxID=574656 RepID=UPI002DDF174A|nr:hypothetical protein LTS14_005439 [Recurvomyces mirabilis]
MQNGQGGNAPQVLRPKGYNKLAILMGRNPQVAILRRFGALNMLNLLYLQAELSELERKFETAYLDDAVSNKADVREFCKSMVALRSSKDGPNGDQLEQLLVIQDKLEKYNAALVQVAEVSKLRHADDRRLFDLQTWLEDSDLGGDFLQATEAQTWTKRHESDLAVLEGPPEEEESLLPALSELPLNLIHCCLGSRGSRRRKPDEETGVFQYDDDGLRRLNKLITTTIASLLPVIAIVVLYAVQGTWRRIYVTIGFTSCFGMALAMTSAKVSEIFAATAAFAAVEVVFIGSVSNGAGG